MTTRTNPPNNNEAKTGREEIATLKARNEKLDLDAQMALKLMHEAIAERDALRSDMDEANTELELLREVERSVTAWLDVDYPLAESLSSYNRWRYNQAEKKGKP
jgi:hypothetical protein